MRPARDPRRRRELLDGRIRVDAIDGACPQLRRGLLGVFLFASAPAALYYLVTVGPILISVLVDGTLPPVGLRYAVVVSLPIPVYVVGGLGYLVRWRRDYEVSLELPDGLLGWP